MSLEEDQVRDASKAESSHGANSDAGKERDNGSKKLEAAEGKRGEKAGANDSGKDSNDAKPSAPRSKKLLIIISSGSTNWAPDAGSELQDRSATLNIIRKLSNASVDSRTEMPI